ncbi:hypothetical protein AVEN_25015-1 [Araneus ventricosus]|uniref:Uncharacterized protein n=1 Tax=Araneus ventricosus TaxID=182803 RepID=A0A4Y2FE14_ARAVE|nr:hypothetical protein AVEN_25015-1 [Araneus ventricosus]
MIAKLKTCDSKKEQGLDYMLGEVYGNYKQEKGDASKTVELNVNNKLKFKTALLKGTFENSAMNKMSIRKAMSALKQFLTKAF